MVKAVETVLRVKAVMLNAVIRREKRVTIMWLRLLLHDFKRKIIHGNVTVIEVPKRR